MRPTKRTIAFIAAPLLVLGWAAFRPELLLLDKHIDERAPAAARLTTLAAGEFKGYAHETTGKAALVQADEKTILRLTGFATSNGPDVRVYLVKGSKSDDESVINNGFLDLGSIKGNKGDQNYAVPEGTKLDQYGAVAIWCKRFSVDFGGATLTKTVAFAPRPTDATTIYFASFGSAIVERGSEPPISIR